MQYYLHALRNYAVFQGRARRKEYWMFTLFHIIFAIVAMVADVVLGTAMDGIGYGPVYMLYALAMFIPGLAVSVRRLHDVNKSGWFMFIVLIPLVGAIWLLVLDCTEGTRGDNQYGADPKQEPVLAY
ncbi:DUF805 domain-containing protein [Hymenobacter taeanensis]|uniref:DUF805 domain-containing protein n=1 Tax=Hymenobacter taeanensis TaxID=2735321 RepID=A0A6M6BEI0_9BACT|nr:MULTISPECIES: DUF805 domain-containing protein [Hymenobacter]QJX46420.1 DUF805 domain-containing protein [Hymenobacter taeanensis]UOQ80281.1 DUF805 domain-containing protein [Hymenobacter sp. 5414T-23]